MKHMSYELSKALKEFLGEDMVEPIDYKFWNKKDEHPAYKSKDKLSASYPVYTLEDLLSKKFCKALASKYKGPLWINKRSDLLQLNLCGRYYDNGFPAVESALWEMIGQKGK